MGSKKKNPPKAIPHDPFEDMEISEALIPDDVEILGNGAEGIVPGSSALDTAEIEPQVAVGSTTSEDDGKGDAVIEVPQDEFETGTETETHVEDASDQVEQPEPVDEFELGIESPETSAEPVLGPLENTDDTVDERILPAPLVDMITEDAEYALPEPIEEQHIIFSLAGREYAAHISNIVEIGYPLNVTPLPNVPDWVLGLTNLRGDVISIFDLRAFLGFGKIPHAGETRLLIAKTLEGDFNVGLIVDSVHGIRYLNIDQIGEPAADITAQVARYVSGSYELDERIIALLDLQRLLSSSEMRQFEPA